MQIIKEVVAFLDSDVILDDNYSTLLEYFDIKDLIAIQGIDKALIEKKVNY